MDRIAVLFAVLLLATPVAAGERLQDLLDSMERTRSSAAPPATPAPPTAPVAAPPKPDAPELPWASPAPVVPAVPVDTAAGEATASLDSFAAEMLASHNRIRAEAGAPPLQWSPDLAADATTWSNDLATRGCVLQHSPQKVGENLAGFTGRERSPVEVVEAWEREKACYTGAPISAPGWCTSDCRTCGHYTQIIWKATRFVGCGYARCTDRMVWTCQYEPLGNVRGLVP